MKKNFIRIIFFVIFVLALYGVILYARGYRLDLNKKEVTSTGILAVSSSPNAAKIYVNGDLKGASNTNITLPNGKYKVEIKKEGYTSWSKEITLKGELVISLDALLYPINPSLSPLTNLGIIKALQVDQEDKFLLFSQKDDPETDGIYLFESTRKPLSFLAPLKLLVLKKNLPVEADLSNVSVEFSPDYKQAVLTMDQNNNFIKQKASFLISFDSDNTNLFDITPTIDSLLTAWQEQRSKDIKKIMETFPDDLAKTASDSFKIISFSPDETKILYQAKKTAVVPQIITPPLIAANQIPEQRKIVKGNIYVYDAKEDKNYLISTKENDNSILWYSDSKRLALKENKKMVMIDYDNTNKETVYSGPFNQEFFGINTEGKLVVLTNLNPEANKYADLYLVGIK